MRPMKNVLIPGKVMLCYNVEYNMILFQLQRKPAHFPLSLWKIDYYLCMDNGYGYGMIRSSL